MVIDALLRIAWTINSRIFVHVLPDMCEGLQGYSVQEMALAHVTFQ